MSDEAKELEREQKELEKELDKLIEDEIKQYAGRNAAIFVGVIALGVVLDFGLLLLLGA
jgi:hypothetical protein